MGHKNDRIGELNSFWLRGLGDRHMSCKPGVAGSISLFLHKKKNNFGEPLGVPVIKPTQILN